VIRRRRWLAAATAAALFVPFSVALAATTGGADVQISGSASTGSPNPGAQFSYTFQVKNSGPDTATGVTFSDPIPAGMSYMTAVLNGTPNLCTSAPDAGGNTVVSCGMGSILKGGQSTVVVWVFAPTTAGTYANTGTATSNVSDPQPANNAVTVNIQVKVIACTLPSNQTILTGVVMLKDTNSFGLFENFELNANGINYWVATNFYDGTRPLTLVINLNCKQVPVQYIQVGGTVTVAGTLDGSTLTLPGSSTAMPVIAATVVQVPTFLDKVA